MTYKVSITIRTIGDKLRLPQVKLLEPNNRSYGTYNNINNIYNNIFSILVILLYILFILLFYNITKFAKSKKILLNENTNDSSASFD